MKLKAPCMNCEERKEGCHKSCCLYIEYQKLCCDKHNFEKVVYSHDYVPTDKYKSGAKSNGKFKLDKYE